MSEWIDRVAKAISLWDGDDWDGVLGSRECSRNRYRAMARAAIEAMREPTPEMKEAMEPWTRVSGHQDGVWKAGIDAALK